MWNKYLAREWPSYIVGPDLETVPFGESHPVDAGVYFMFADDEQLIYIGQSVGIEYRLTQHYWAGRRCASYGAVAVPGDLLDPVEFAYIHALRPPLNRQYRRSYCGDLHDKMVAAIQAAWEHTHILVPAPVLEIEPRSFEVAA